MLINNQRYAQLAGCNYDDYIVKQGPIVYSRTHLVTEQFKSLRTFRPCKLITSFSDASVTQYMADKLPDNITWYSNNVGCDHPRVKAIPIGCVYNIEREKILLGCQKVRLKRDKLLYINFTRHIQRDPNPRKGLYEFFPWATRKGGAGYDSVTAVEFYTDLQSHYYCLSPHGAGPDCHRTWEAMLLGCIPIVLACKENEILEGMPALRVSDWSHVTEDTLISILPEYQARFTQANIRKLYFDYWKDEICKS